MDKQTAYDELNRLLAERSIREDEFFLRDYASDNGLTVDFAKGFLEALEREGLVEMRVISYPRRAMVFRFVNGPVKPITKRGRKAKTF